MKNGTTSSSLRFSDEGSAVEETAEPDNRDLDKRIAIAVGIAAAAAAIAAGVYVAWLLRKRDADAAISDVHGLVQSCEDRFAEIETELKRIGS